MLGPHPPGESFLGRRAVRIACGSCIFYPSCVSHQGMKKTYVYIDGFNFYYSAVKDTPFRWLDFSKLLPRVFPKNQTCRIKYFTADVTPFPGNGKAPKRQQAYLRALRSRNHQGTLPDPPETHEGCESTASILEGFLYGRKRVRCEYRFTPSLGRDAECV